MITVGTADTLFRDVVPWLAALLALVVVGAVLIAWLRRLSRGGNGSGEEGFSLHQLREMHASGLLSDEEFERARAEVIGRLRPTTDPDGSGSPSPPKDR